MFRSPAPQVPAAPPPPPNPPMFGSRPIGTPGGGGSDSRSTGYLGTILGGSTDPAQTGKKTLLGQ